MPDKPSSPFSGLDKALLRSTRREPAAPAFEPQQPAVEAPIPASPPTETTKEEQTRARIGARVHARTEAQTEAPTHALLQEDLYRRLQSKQRLASQTFRFRPEELEELDNVFAELDQKDSRKLSKNDLVRLGLNWLLTDYKANREDSVLARVLARA